MVDFHGWAMPLRYGSIPDEHRKVRLSAGLFDLSHMGRLEIAGPDAAAWTDRAITNDYAAMKPGAARYTLIANERGNILDDAIVYKLPDRAFLVVNASNRKKIVDWLLDAQGDLDARLTDRTADLAMVSIQGPQSVRILPAALESFEGDWEAMRYYSIARARIRGKEAWVARTGYTGEDGFEVYLDAEDAPAFWRSVLEIGGNRIAPIGLGARDTLRLEAAMPLYGNEIDEGTNPFEAGLSFAVKLEKAVPFIGQEALRAIAKGPLARRLRGFRVLGGRVARAGMSVYLETDSSRPVGRITSGAPSPTLGYPIALGYLDASVGERDYGALVVDVRGRRERLQVEALPFYSRTRRKES